MPKSKGFSILVDTSHGEILNLSDEDFKPFWELLMDYGYKISSNESGKLTEDILKDKNLLIIGCPVNHYLLNEEIRLITDFVIAGGNLLVMSEYGGDSVQSTNLNDLTKNFGIYFENTAMRAKESKGSTSLPLIRDIREHNITKNVRKLMFGGCCSLRTAKDAQSVCFSSEDSWIEIYDDLKNKWIKYDNSKLPLIGVTVFGQGRVIALGDIDIFGSNKRFGLESLDNKRLIQNIFNYFNSQVDSDTIMEWMLGQFSMFRDTFVEVYDKISSITEKIGSMEKKIAQIEEIQVINQFKPGNLKRELASSKKRYFDSHISEIKAQNINHLNPESENIRKPRTIDKINYKVNQNKID